MTDLRTKHRGFMSWVRSGGYLPNIDEHGDKFTQACLFFYDIEADGTLSPAISSIDYYMGQAQEIAAKWPHIRWLITVKNDGIEERINPIIRNDPVKDASGNIKWYAQDKFISEIHRILDKYPWVDGLDADLERLNENPDNEIYALYDRIYRGVHSRSQSTWVSLDLPAMTGPYETVGPEKWCAYERLAGKFDSAQIMTYGYAYAGSAPGPTSPVYWLHDVFDYVVTAIDPEKCFMGVAAYGYRWEIYKYPSGYRGAAGGFAPFLRWMLGGSTHTDTNHSGTGTQQYVPFFSFYDDENFVHDLFIHVYDYPGAGEEENRKYPMVEGQYDRPFLTCYGKTQKAGFSGVYVNQTGTDFVSKSGSLDVDQNAGMVRPVPQTKGETQDGYAKYTFDVPADGTYKIVLHVKYPWWDQDLLHFALDGTGYDIGQNPQWYPYFQSIHWVLMDSLTLTAGTHTLELIGAQSQYLTQFYGFKVCDAFTDEFYGGEADLTVRPRYFSDVNRADAWPYQNKFKATPEALRRDPDYVQIWYDDFRDWQSSLPGDRYNIISGSWQVNHDPDDPSTRPYSWVTGSGQFNLAYSGFENVVVKSHLKTDEQGRAGVFFAGLWFCMNTNNGDLELYKNGSLIDSYGSTYQTGAYYTISMRIRGTEVTCYGGESRVIQTSLSSAVGSGAFGIKSDAKMTTDLLRGGDAHWYYPQEAIDITLPNGTTQTLGRIPRTSVTWDHYWGFFKISSGEEYTTRTDPSSGLPKTIDKDWAYLHSDVFALDRPGDYKIHIKVRDIGFWLSRVFLGDADGFSLAVFPDAHTIIQMANIAAYQYKIQGVGMWALGQEDPNLWNMLVSQV